MSAYAGVWLNAGAVRDYCGDAGLARALDIAESAGIAGVQVANRTELEAVQETLGVMLLGARKPDELDELDPDVAACGIPELPRLVAQAEALDIDLCLDLDESELKPNVIASASSAFEGVSIIRLPRVDEACLDEIAGREHLEALVPGQEFATGFRFGAALIDGELPLLSPHFAVRAFEACETDVAGALELQRRLERFMETSLRPALRRGGHQTDDLSVALLQIGGWCPPPRPSSIQRRRLSLLEEEAAQDLREDLRSLCPEWEGPG